MAPVIDRLSLNIRISTIAAVAGGTDRFMGSGGRSRARANAMAEHATTGLPVFHHSYLAKIPVIH